MKKISILLFTLCMGTVLRGGNFLSHSKAVSAGRSGDHAQAQKFLQNAIVVSPENSDILYDAGVAEFKCGNHKNAAHYFEKAHQYATQNQLQENALFNAGNSYAHMKEFDKALECYDKILSKNDL